MMLLLVLSSIFLLLTIVLLIRQARSNSVSINLISRYAATIRVKNAIIAELNRTIDSYNGIMSISNTRDNLSEIDSDKGI